MEVPAIVPPPPPRIPVFASVPEPAVVPAKVDVEPVGVPPPVPPGVGVGIGPFRQFEDFANSGVAVGTREVIQEQAMEALREVAHEESIVNADAFVGLRANQQNAAAVAEESMAEAVSEVTVGAGARFPLPVLFAPLLYEAYRIARKAGAGDSVERKLGERRRGRPRDVNKKRVPFKPPARKPSRESVRRRLLRGPGQPVRGVPTGFAGGGFQTRDHVFKITKGVNQRMVEPFRLSDPNL